MLPAAYIAACLSMICWSPVGASPFNPAPGWNNNKTQAPQLPTLLKCLTDDQHALAKKCEEISMTMMKGAKGVSSGYHIEGGECESGKTGSASPIKEEKSQSMREWEHRHEIAHKTSHMVVECILISTGSVENTTGRLNSTRLKETIIDISSLSTEKKTSAGVTLDSCLLSNFTSSSLPLFIEEAKHEATSGGSMNSKKRFTGPGDLEPVNRITMMRTFACATKALVQNGCLDPSIGEEARDHILSHISSMEDMSASTEDSSSEEIGAMKTMKMIAGP